MRLFLSLIYLILITLSLEAQSAIRLKSIARIAGLQDNPITGYGLVIGLAGSGDSRRSKETTQAIANLLLGFGVNLNVKDINSRNAATVIITTNLPPHAHQGDKLDINVASIGDAKSLLGGTLLVTPLKGPDNQIYALAQGPLSIGGFKYDLFGNVLQKNHPTAGIIPDGAIVEKSIYNDLIEKTGELHLILNHPDYTTAYHVERALNKKFNAEIAKARSAQDIEIHPPKEAHGHFIRFISQLEQVTILTDSLPKVVINERTGIVVAGAEVTLDAVSISHGNLQIAISTNYNVSQPSFIRNVSHKVKTVVTPETNMNIKEADARVIKLVAGSSIAELMAALIKKQTSTRDIIAILESLKGAGALHAELIIQ